MALYMKWIAVLVLLFNPPKVFCQEEEEGSGEDVIVTEIVTELMSTEIFSTEMVEIIDGTTAYSSTVSPSASAGSSTSATPSPVDIIPSSFTSASVEYVLDEETNVTYTVNISNSGGTPIAAASSGDNFNISFVASSSSDPTSASSVLSLTTDTSSSTNLGAAISAGGTLVISDIIVTVSIPSASCTDYSYICVQINAADGADYTDSDSTNNYHCVTFGDVSDGYAGIYQCADMEVTGLSVTAYESSTIALDVDNIFTYSVTIENSGNFGIEAAISGNNYALSFALSNSTNLNSANTGTQTYAAETSSSTNLGAGIESGSSVSITVVNAYVNIATADCETYDYVCVVLTKASGANFTDTDTTNNHYCITFGDPSEGYAGILTCSAFISRVSLLMLLVCAWASRFLL